MYMKNGIGLRIYERRKFLNAVYEKKTTTARREMETVWASNNLRDSQTDK